MLLFPCAEFVSKKFLSMYNKANTYEFWAIIIIACVHVSLDLWVSSTMAAYASLLAVLLFTFYVLVRLLKEERIAAKRWGMRLDNLRETFTPYVLFTGIVAI